MLENETNKNKSVENSDQPTDKNTTTQNGFQLPTLDQFMEIVSGEKQTLMATASGYNVYNKYNKTS